MRINYIYAFQGQERDDEIKGRGKSYNFEYRMHDSRLGRFFSVDPLTKDYPWYTPYQFSGNKVIDHIELEGLEEFSIHERGGYLILALTKIDANFVVKDYSSGTLVERKNFHYRGFVNQMKGSTVDKVWGVLFVPNNRGNKEFNNPNDMPGNPITPQFSTHINDWTVAEKKPLEQAVFYADNFGNEEDIFNSHPIEFPMTDNDGNILRDKILPDNDKYDYVDVYITSEYKRDKIINQLEIHGVDVKNKEINFIDKPAAKNLEGKPKTVEVTFGTYE